MKKLSVLALMILLIISCNTNEIETNPVDSPIVHPTVNDTITFEKLEIVSITLSERREDI